MLGLGCTICGKAGDPAKMVKDERWEGYIHTDCRDALTRWYGKGRDPRGPAGTDDRYDFGR